MFFAWLSRRPRHTIVVGAAAKYVVTSSNYAPTAGSGVTITAQLADANNHAVHTAGKVVTWSKSDPGGSFGSPTSTTDANGVATVNFTTSATPSTSTTVTATDGGALTGTSATITTTTSGGFSPDAVMQSLIGGELDGGTITFYTGTRPASTADAPSGSTALGDFTLNTPATQDADLVANDKTVLHVTGGFVNVSGTVAWARAKSADGTKVYDFDVATTTGTNVLVVNAVAWTAGQTMAMVQLTAQG